MHAVTGLERPLQAVNAVSCLQALSRPQVPVRVQGGAQHVVDDAVDLNLWRILREMVKHVWPRDRPGLKLRVVVALGLLVGAKVGGG